MPLGAVPSSPPSLEMHCHDPPSPAPPARRWSRNALLDREGVNEGPHDIDLALRVPAWDKPEAGAAAGRADQVGGRGLLATGLAGLFQDLRHASLHRKQAAMSSRLTAQVQSRTQVLSKPAIRRRRDVSSGAPEAVKWFPLPDWSSQRPATLAPGGSMALT